MKHLPVFFWIIFFAAVVWDTIPEKKIRIFF